MQITKSDSTRSSVSDRTVAWATVGLVGLVLALTAQFFLDAWADQYEAAHWAQHGTLFLAGILIGAAVIRLYQIGSRAA